MSLPTHTICVQGMIPEHNYLFCLPYGWVKSNYSGESFICMDVSEVRVWSLLNFTERDGNHNGIAGGGGGGHVVPLQMEKGGHA